MRITQYVALTLAWACTTAALAQTPLGTSFTYQGSLSAPGMPAIGNADFRLALFDAASGGAQIGTTLAKDNVAVVNGVFALTLDFGAAAFRGNARWLELSIRSPAGAGGFTTLVPRQLVTVTPHATFSLQTRGISVDETGQVGIGTASPGKRLTVAGDMELGTTQGDNHHLRFRCGSSDGFLFSGNSNSSGVADGIHLGFNYYVDSAGIDQVPTDAGTSRLSLSGGAISLATQNPGTLGVGHVPINRMVVTPAGNVGIGTSNPQARLHVDGDFVVQGDSYLGLIDGHIRIMGGRQSTSDSEHLIWKMSDYLTITHAPDGTIGNVYNPELRMISPVTGDELAGFYRDFETGNGVMFADDKNFRAPNPADAATDIWYCCLEGPEAAMYVRGIGRLINGRAIVLLPDHFRNLAHEPGMTVQLTPRSLDSKGLATTKVTLAGIEVGELGGGRGNYEFDWRVEAVRKGWEDYRVIRPWLRSDPDVDQAWKSRLKAIEERRAHGKPVPSRELIPESCPD